MAEPVSSLPASSEKNVPIPWPSPPEKKMPAKVYVARTDFNLQLGRRAARRSWHTLQSTISGALSRAKSSIARLKREQPLEIIAAAAVAGVLLGTSLRVWRSRHEGSRY